ncbi:MAG: DsbA family protein [Deltaproteobacteria bacterium]|nr:DsbA family protein [Deltaproteobacteria bacterium]MBW2698683.1 DsbA family protein [Deltaproteobacteria bacterium]
MNSGNAIIVAGTILALAILGSAYMMVTSIDGASNQLANLGGSVSKLQLAAAPAAAPAQPSRRRGPDPAKTYKVDTVGRPTKGPANAAITLVEFSDFQCPFCSRVGPTLKQVREEYPNDVKIVFKHLPLSIHPKAQGAHAAAEAAHQQGKFWEMHDKIFADQRQLTESKYIEYAGEIGLDVDRFKKDMASAEVKKRVAADSAEAARLGVTGTPGFFINGKFVSGAKPFSEFKRIIDGQLKG